MNYKGLFFGLFDSSGLKQGAYALYLLVLVLLQQNIPVVDKRLLIEMNNDIANIPWSVWTDRGYYFIKVVQMLELIMFWIGARRFKDFLQQENFTAQSLLFYVSLVIGLWILEIQVGLLVVLLLLTELRSKKLGPSINSQRA